LHSLLLIKKIYRRGGFCKKAHTPALRFVWSGSLYSRPLWGRGCPYRTWRLAPQRGLGWHPGRAGRSWRQGRGNPLRQGIAFPYAWQ